MEENACTLFWNVMLMQLKFIYIVNRKVNETILSISYINILIFVCYHAFIMLFESTVYIYTVETSTAHFLLFILRLVSYKTRYIYVYIYTYSYLLLL